MRAGRAASSVEEIAALAQTAAKYRSMSPLLVRSIAAEEITRHGKQDDVIKHVRRRLHQAAGAYLAGKPCYGAWLKEMQNSASDSDGFRSVCMRIMSLHSSSRERADFLAEFYDTLFEAIPPVRSVADLACGYNPLAIPWMQLSLGCRYLAIDIYSDLADFLNEALLLTGVSCRAVVADLLQPCPQLSSRFDLVLILKTLPCLEQLRKGSALALLQSLNARHIAISYPTHSLGGRRKGMEQFYECWFRKLADEQGWMVRHFSFARETLYIVEKKENNNPPPGEF
ncbi:MAG TPA: hypothetical protein VLH60_08335 [Sedimentisphaerales bacterium]|nr:hypothetical protein [Sedimentisphaerales bacterium]